jgi:universal stress protein A
MFRRARKAKGGVILDIQQILVPVDYSDDSRAALQWAASLAENYGARILLLHIIGKAVEEVYPQGTHFETLMPSYYEGLAPGSQRFGRQLVIIDLEAQARTRLQNYASEYLPRNITVEVKVGVGKPADSIVQLAREEGVDLIVMGTHGRTGMRHLLLGSIAEAVIRQVQCPVMTVRGGLDGQLHLEAGEDSNTSIIRSVVVI